MTAHRCHVVGLDLSISATGIAHADGTTSTVGGGAHLGDDRLRVIRAACYQAVHTDPPPALVVLEAPMLYGPGHEALFAMGMVHGAVRHMLLRTPVPWTFVTPADLKKHATGNGNATKDDMAAALIRDHGLRLPDDNQVDAWYLRHLGLAALARAPIPRDRRPDHLRQWLKNLTFTPQPTGAP